MSEEHQELTPEQRREARQQRIAELEKQRTELLEDAEEQAEEERILHLEQELQDRARQRELEREHGFNRILGVAFDAWKPGVGAATRFVCVLPDARGRLFKKAQQQMARADERDKMALIEASEKLALSCLKYPHPENDHKLYEATSNLAPGILGNLAKQLVDKVAGRERATRGK